jgi:Domain of unknown function (DUF4178)
VNPNVPQSSSPPKSAAKALNCPGCGAAITLRALGQALSVVCESCHAILDARDPNLAILQSFRKIASPDPPLIPLGTRGRIRANDYEVIGFERRSISVDGIGYRWHEYVLFNPYRGFRYLTEYQGHWNDVVVCKEQPILNSRFRIPLEANYLGEVYKHFQTADATTEFVLGEFPWKVAVGEHAQVTDLIRPPRVLSMERVSGEMNWSIGEYMYGREIWNAFRLSGEPPEAVGVYENQPSTFTTNLRQVWLAFAAFALLLVAMMVEVDIQAANKPVFHAGYQLNSGEPKGEASFVTDTFELTGRTSSVAVSTSADVRNSWIYLNYALINQDTGQAWDFAREVTFYSGYDSDGSWSEGGQNDTVVVPSVPPGHYYLRIEPEADRLHPRIVYTVDVKRDVPVHVFYGIGLLVLLIPPVFITWRSMSFERSRWSESDHPPNRILNLNASSEDDD